MPDAQAAPRVYPVPASPTPVRRTTGGTGRTAVVLGAGPAGLIAALTIRQEGYDDVRVFERRATFSRGNVLNLHPESLHVLVRLGVLDAFLARASLISDHRTNVYAGGVEVYRFSDSGQPVAIDPEHRFDADDVTDGFRNETLYGITLAELQDVLATAAAARGIAIVPRAAAHVVPARSGMHAVRVDLLDHGTSFTVEAPGLIVAADGTKGLGAHAVGADYVDANGLWPDEAWVFGNCRCEPTHGFSNLLFEFEGKGLDELVISNSIFLPNKGEVNIAVTVRADVSSAEAETLIATQFVKILAISGVSSSMGGGVLWHTGRAVRIAARSARRVHFGRNVVLAGDAAGANSPVAAFGGTLSTSAYSYAIRHLVRDLDTSGAETALAAYARRAEAYVARWHARVAELRRAVDVEVRSTSLRLLAGSTGHRDQPAAERQ